MKFKLSKLHFALLAAGFGSAVCGTTYALTSDSFPVVVPVNKAMYYGAVTGLWATATNDDLYYAMTGTRDSSGSRSFHNIEPDNCWGWRLDLGYLIPCTGNDVSVNWTYYSADEDCSTSGRAWSRYIPTNRGASWSRVSADACFDYSAVNIELGQRVDFCSLHTRFHMGLTWASIEHEIDSSAVGSGRESSDDRSNSGRSHVESDFWGIGPRFGVDLTYPLGSPGGSFSVVSHLSGSLLAGEICIEEKASTSTVSQNRNNSGSRSAASFNVRSDDICTVLPAGTLKIGLAYSSHYDPGCPGYAVEVGYQATGYFHSVSHSLDFDRAHRTGIINPVSNFGIYGWYLTVSYAG